MGKDTLGVAMQGAHRPPFDIQSDIPALPTRMIAPLIPKNSDLRRATSYDDEFRPVPDWRFSGF